MKRYRLVFRGNRNTYCCFDTQTQKRERLGADSKAEAQRLIDAKNEAVRHPEMNLQIAQVYLQHSDPGLSARTWQEVMEKIISLKTGPTQERWQYAKKDKGHRRSGAQRRPPMAFLVNIVITALRKRNTLLLHGPG